MSDEKTVTAAVIIIGNEILSGRTQDTNLNYIAKYLGTKGVSVKAAWVIPDLHEVVVNTVNQARENFDYVLTTGGIGPTHDDITAECIAKAFDVELVVDDKIASRIRQRPAPEHVMESRLRMARVPKGASLIENSTGGPQGFSMENVHVMAGFPRVMQAMIGNIPFQGGPVVHSCSVTAYMGESEIADELTTLQKDHPAVDIGSYPFSRNNRYGTSLVIRGTDIEELNLVLNSICATITAKEETPEDIERP